MTKQVITFGTPPTGIGGDSYRTAFGKCNENFTEVYDKIAYFEGAPKAASSFSIYRDVLSNYRAASSLKGALVIHLPKAKNKSTTMLSLRIRGYNYQSNNGEWDLQVGGYNYSSGWMQCSANLNGPAPFTQVQLGMASDHQVIIIGTASTVWAYPRFNIEELIAGYSNHASGWNTGLSVEYETDLSAYTGIITPVLYGWTQVLTAEKLTTARTIGGVSFDGSANINLPGVNTAGNQNTSGNAASATKLQTARTIGGVSFNGTANINLPGVNTAGNQNTSGNAASATKLATARTINGVSFNGTANITVADSTKLPLAGGTVTGALTVNGLITAGSNGIKTAKIDSASAVGFFNGTAAQNIHTGGLLVSNAYADSTKIPTNGIYSKGKVQADGGFQGALTGNADSATKLATARTIGGVSFNGTANINLPGVNTAGNQNTSGNAASATKLATARTINGVSFDGTANITVVDSTKLPLAGGTLTGALKVNNTTASTSATTGAITTTGGVGIGGALFTTGAITSANNITAYSDIRIKDNITVIDDALNKVNQLKGVTFNRTDVDDKDKRYVGLIAQDVQSVMPEAVNVNDDEINTLSVDYQGLIGLLVESIKELKLEIDVLKGKVK